MAIGTDFQLNWMRIVVPSCEGYFAIESGYLKRVVSYFVRYFEGGCGVLV